MLSQAEKDSPDSRIPDLTPNRDVAFESQMLKLRTPHLEPQGELRLARSLSQMIGPTSLNGVQQRVIVHRGLPRLSASPNF